MKTKIKVLRGLCSVCLRRFRLRKDGTLCYHPSGLPTRVIYACIGAGRAPIVEGGYLRIKNGLPPPELAPYGHDDPGNPSARSGAQPDIH